MPGGGDYASYAFSLRGENAVGLRWMLLAASQCNILGSLYQSGRQQNRCQISLSFFANGGLTALCFQRQVERLVV